jgi:hypothetical protein
LPWLPWLLMAKHKYLSNFDVFLYDLIPFLACWIMIAPICTCPCTLPWSWIIT